MLSKIAILSIVIVTSVFSSNAQQDSTEVALALDTLMVYDANFEVSGYGEEAIFKINGTIVSESEFTKYHRYKKNKSRCRPCIMRTYNLNDELLYEGLQHSNCRAGSFKFYYPDGNLHVNAEYVGRPLKGFKGAGEHDYCRVKTGKWDYFSESGENIYSEYWDTNIFVKQVPEQDQTEIWEADFLLNDLPIAIASISISDLNKVVVIPKYKNSHRDGELYLELEVWAFEQETIYKEFTFQSFKEMDINLILKEMGNPLPIDIYCYIHLKMNGQTIDSQHLKLRH
ncbi:MAG: hypothetical protein ACI837_001702 [Crocinitomicaceae bacterium]|jgi:hypothetical protein